VFAGRRWVATRDLQTLRYPHDSPIAQPLSRGCYISTYIHQPGHHDEVVRWYIAAMAGNLYPNGRGFTDRTHVFTTHAPYSFGVVRDGEGPMRPWHALDHPYVGLVLEVIDPGHLDRRPELIEKLEHDFVPGQLAGSPAGVCLGFAATVLDNGGVVPGVPDVPDQERLIAVLWLLEVDPRRCWSHFLPHGDLIKSAGGSLLLAAPFIPTLPGTNTYVNELR
jgi:hypothetical protein